MHNGLPARSVMELLSLASTKSGELTFVSPGVGTPGHLTASLLMHLTGIQGTHIPYKDGGQTVQDLLAGHVTFTIEGPTLLKPFVDNGRLRVLAVTTPQPTRCPTCRSWLRPAYRVTSSPPGRVSAHRPAHRDP